MKTLMILLSLTASVAADHRPYQQYVPSGCDINSGACWYHVDQKPATQDERIKILANDDGVTL